MSQDNSHLVAPDGNSIIKIDFHIHTPVSRCYEDHMYPELNRNTQADDIVLAAIYSGLDAIAITDHNSAAFIESAQSAAKGTKLMIFPGMEITAQGCHMLAVFDPDTPLNWLDRFLSAIGFEQLDKRGDAYYSTEHPIDEVSRLVEDLGGLAIAAHVDREPRGFIASSFIGRDVKRRIHESDHLSALEITDPRDKELWNSGQMRGYPKPYACVQGSDAHAPAEVGRRPTFLKVPSADLSNIRLAFKEYQDRVLFPEELEHMFQHEHTH